MKKLIIAAAVAAMGAGAFAAPASTGEQAYTMTLTIKTTYGAYGRYADTLLDCEEVTTGYFRKQCTEKLAGLIWGCWCDTIAAPAPGDFSGYVFWNVTRRYQYVPNQKFEWKALDKSILNRISNNGKVVEGLWSLELTKPAVGNTAEYVDYSLVGAGFGKVGGGRILSDTKSSVWISSMSGYCAGWHVYDCSVTGHCGEADTNGVAYWPLCLCGDVEDATAAYGTWSLKFNTTVATRFARTGDIATAYNFPAYVTDVLGE